MSLACSPYFSIEILHILWKPAPMLSLPEGFPRFSMWNYRGLMKLLLVHWLVTYYLPWLELIPVLWFGGCITDKASENVLALGCMFVYGQHEISSFSETLSSALLLNLHLRELARKYRKEQQELRYWKRQQMMVQSKQEQIRLLRKKHLNNNMLLKWCPACIVHYVLWQNGRFA